MMLYIPSDSKLSQRYAPFEFTARLAISLNVLECLVGSEPITLDKSEKVALDYLAVNGGTQFKHDHPAINCTATLNGLARKGLARATCAGIFWEITPKGLEAVK